MPIIEDIPQLPSRAGGGIIEDLPRGGIIEDLGQEQGPGVLRQGLATAAAILPPMAGYALGGGPVGGGIGGYLGELAREGILGEPLSQKAALLEGGLATIPFGKGLGLIKGPVSGALVRGTQAALFGAGAEFPRQYVRTGELPSAGQVGRAAGIAGLIGGPFGAVEGRYFPPGGRATAAPAAEPPPVVARGGIIEDLPPGPVLPSERLPPGPPEFGPQAPRTGAGQPELFGLTGLTPQQKASRALRSAADALDEAAAPPRPRAPEPVAPGARQEPRAAEIPPAAPEAPPIRSQADLATSPEAISRVKGEKARGAEFFRIDSRGGKPQRLPSTVDRVDVGVSPTQVIFRREGGKVLVEQQGAQVTPGRLARLRRLVEQEGAAPAPKAARAPVAAVETPPVEAPAMRGPVGREGEAFGIINPNERYRYRYRVAEIDDLAVNDPEIQGLTRDRSRATSQQEIDRIERDFDSDRWLAGNEELDRGVPLTRSDNKVISGNGRIQALRQLREHDPARFAAFIERQRERAVEFGLNPEHIGANSVIVRELTSPITDWPAFAAEANARVALAQAPVELAAGDAARLPPQALTALQIGESQTIDAALTSPRNKGLIGQFLDSFPPNERAGLVTEDANALNSAGVQRLKAALLARTYHGEPGRQLLKSLTESTDSNIKNLETAIFRSLGKMLKATELVRDGARNSDLDITGDVVTVARKLSNLRSQGMSVDYYLRQQQLGGRELTPFQESLLDAIDVAARSEVRIRRLLNGLADEIIASPPPGQTGLFGKMVTIKEDLLANALSRAGETGLLGEVGAVGRGHRRRRPRLRGGLGGAGLNEPGTAEPPAPPAGQPRAVDELGRPIQTGRLSSDRPESMARSLTDQVETAGGAAKLRDEIALANRDAIEYARRGVVPVKHTKELADRLGMTSDKLAKRLRGEALNAEQLLASVELNNREIALARLAVERAARTGSDVDQFHALRWMVQVRRNLQETTGGVAEAGRALRILQETGNEPSRAGLERLLRVAGSRENVDEIMANFLRILPDDFVAQNKFIAGVVEYGLGDMAYELWINGLISAAHVINTLSNAVFALERPAFKPAQVAGDLMRAGLTGTKRERFMGEVPADLLGMARGIRGGVRAALQTWRTEIPSEGGFKLLERGTRPQAIPGRFGRTVRIQSRAMMAADDFFKAINSQGQLYALAYRRAAREGRRGDALINRIAEIVSRPDAIEGLRDAMQREALYRTFNEREGVIKAAVINLRNAGQFGKVARFIMPFVTTPLNVAKVGIERSPLSLLDMMIRFKQRTLRGADLSDELTRAAVGTAVAAEVVSLVQDNLITGGGPVDAKRRQAWRAAGAQPYSFRIPKELADRLGIEPQWINYGRLEPFGITIGLAADFGELMLNTEVEDAISKIAFLFGRNLSSKTFMKGVSDFIDAVEDPDRYGERYIQNLAGTLIPTIVARVARITDPRIRRPRTVAEVLRSRLPVPPKIDVSGLGTAEEITPIRDVFGEIVMRVGGPVERFLLPFPRSIISEDAARQEIQRLEVAPGSPRRQLGDMELTDDEYDRYVMASGRLAKGRIDRLVRSPYYVQLSDDRKIEALMLQFREGREQARKFIRPMARRRVGVRR